MRFDPELFASGQNNYLNLKRQQMDQAQQAYDAGIQADDRGAIEAARAKMEGKSGLLYQLFGGQDPAERSSGLENIYAGDYKPGQKANGYDMSVKDMGLLDGPQVYSMYEQGFKDRMSKARNNTDIANAVMEYKNSVAKADRYFKNDYSKGIDVRDYLRSGGSGPGKLVPLNVLGSDGETLSQVHVPENILADENATDNYLKQNFSKAYGAGIRAVNLQRASSQAPLNAKQIVEGRIAQEALYGTKYGNADEEAIANKNRQLAAVNKRLVTSRGWTNYLPGTDKYNVSLEDIPNASMAGNPYSGTMDAGTGNDKKNLQKKKPWEK